MLAVVILVVAVVLTRIKWEQDTTYRVHQMSLEALKAKKKMLRDLLEDAERMRQDGQITPDRFWERTRDTREELAVIEEQILQLQPDYKPEVMKCPNCGAKNRIPKARLNDRPICGKCKKPLASGTSYDHPVTITDATFSQEVLSYPGPVLVDCWAPWCGPCRMVAPVLDQLASEYAGQIKIAKVNVDDNPVTASQYGIQSIPTMLFFKNGNLIDQKVGALPKQEIERHIKNISGIAG